MYSWHSALLSNKSSLLTFDLVNYQKYLPFFHWSLPYQTVWLDNKMLTSACSWYFLKNASTKMNATWPRPFLSQLRVWLSWLTLSLVKKKGGGIGEEKSSDLNGTHFCVFWRYSICCMNGASLTNLMCTLTSGSELHIHLVNTCNFTTIMVWKVIMQWSRCWWEAKCLPLLGQTVCCKCQTYLHVPLTRMWMLDVCSHVGGGGEGGEGITFHF